MGSHNVHQEYYVITCLILRLSFYTLACSMGMACYKANNRVYIFKGKFHRPLQRFTKRHHRADGLEVKLQTCRICPTFGLILWHSDRLSCLRFLLHFLQVKGHFQAKFYGTNPSLSCQDYSGGGKAWMTRESGWLHGDAVEQGTYKISLFYT